MSNPIRPSVCATAFAVVWLATTIQAPARAQDCGTTRISVSSSGGGR